MEDFEGIIDDDPALDIIMIEEMEKKSNMNRGRGENGGCLSVVALFFIPPLFIIGKFVA